MSKRALQPFDPIQVSPSDRRRAAALLSSAVTGDRLGLTAGIVSAQRCERVGPTVQALAGLLIETVPEVQSTAIVDRLRGVLSEPPDEDPAPRTRGSAQRRRSEAHAPPATAERLPVRESISQFEAWMTSCSTPRGVQKLDT